MIAYDRVSAIGSSTGLGSMTATYACGLNTLYMKLYPGYTRTCSRCRYCYRCWCPALARTWPCLRSSPAQALGRSRALRCGGGRAELQMSALEEQPVTADEAIALINKAKTIVEADMGTKVYRYLSSCSHTLAPCCVIMGER